MRRIYLMGAMVVTATIVALLLTLNVSATTWSDSIVIDAPAKNPEVAIDSTGGLHFVWLNPQASRIEYRHCADTATCDAVQELPAPDGDAYAPAFVLDAQDRPNVVWEQRNGNKSAILYSRRNSGGWSEPARVSDQAKSMRPDIAIGTDGVKHIVYETIEPNGGGVYHATRGGGSNTLQLVEMEKAETATGASEQLASGRNARIAIDNNDRAHIVWNTTSQTSRVKYSYQNANGVFVTPILVADQDKAQEPDLAVDRETNRVGIIWETKRDDLVSFAVYKKGERVFRQNNISGSNETVRRPRIAADCGGRFHLVFQRQRLLQTDWNIYHRSFDPASETFTSSERVTESNTDDATPVIATTNFIALGYIVADNNTLQLMLTEPAAICYGDPTPTPTPLPTSPSEGWEHIPNNDVRIVYKKGWTTQDANKASETNFARCQTGGSCKKNSSVEFSWTGGTRVEWVTAYANNYGKADVYIDGEAFEIVDLCALNRNAAKPKFGTRTYLLEGNETTPHSIKIVAVGHSGCATNNRNFVAVDGFNILR